MLELKDLMALKNSLIQDLELAKKRSPKSEEIYFLANQAAEHESVIAQKLIDSGYSERAVVNLISQASCLIDASRLEESITVYYRALSYCKFESLRQWIMQEIQTIKANHTTL